MENTAIYVNKYGSIARILVETGIQVYLKCYEQFMHT